MKKAPSKSQVIRDEVKRVAKRFNLAEKDRIADAYNVTVSLDLETREILDWAAFAETTSPQAFSRKAIREASLKAVRHWHMMVVPPEDFLAAMHLLAMHHELKDEEPTPALKKAVKRLKKMEAKQQKR